MAGAPAVLASFGLEVLVLLVGAEVERHLREHRRAQGVLVGCLQVHRCRERHRQARAPEGAGAGKQAARRERVERVGERGPADDVAEDEHAVVGGDRRDDALELGDVLVGALAVAQAAAQDVLALSHEHVEDAVQAGRKGSVTDQEQIPHDAFLPVAHAAALRRRAV